MVLTRDQMADATKPGGSIYQYLYFDRLTTAQPYIDVRLAPVADADHHRRRGIGLGHAHPRRPAGPHRRGSGRRPRHLQQAAALDRPASFLIKDVGQQYGVDTGRKDQFPIESYDTIDMSLHYLPPLPQRHQLDLGVQVTNLFNNTSLIGYAGAAAGNGAPLYRVNAGRGVFFSVSARL